MYSVIKRRSAVADCEPIAGYPTRSEAYDGPVYVAGHSRAQYAHAANPAYVETSAQCGMLLHSAYSVRPRFVYENTSMIVTVCFR